MSVTQTDITRKDIKVSVFELDGSKFPTDPEEFLLYWEEKINLVPLQYRNTTRIESCFFRREYGEFWAKIVISYMRPETDEEFYHREKVEKHSKKIKEDIAKLQLKQLGINYVL